MSSLLDWPFDFLCARKEPFVLDRILSHAVLLEADVPKGGVLKPILFLLCTHWKTLSLENGLYHFADNFTLYRIVLYDSAMHVVA